MLRSTIALTLGSKLYDQQTIAFRLRRTQLPALDRLEVFFPAAVEFDASPGEDCSLEMDGGDGAATVFTGKLTHVRRSFSGLTLTAHNGGLPLARFRPSVSYEKMTVGEIVDALCGEVAVTVGQRIDGPTLALHVTDGRSTAAEEIARLALHAGGIAAFSGDGELHVTEEGGPAGEMALLYGRELIAVEMNEILNELPPITVIGDGGGAPASSEGRWVIADFSSGSAPAPGVSARIVTRPEIRTTDDADVAAAALMQRRSAALSPVKLRMWLNPAIEPGMRLELAEMPESVPLSECRVSQLVSTCTPGGPMVTDVWATGSVQ